MIKLTQVKRSLLLIFILMSGYPLMAQPRMSYSEFGIGVQTLNYSGDIATTTNVSAILSEIRPNFKVYGMRHFSDWFAMGAEFSYGWFYANDENHSNPTRGLSVYTTMTHINAFMEINLIRYGKYHFARKFGLYLKTGGGLLAYNPHISFNNQLTPEFIPYPNSYSDFNYFFGGGMKFRVSYRGTLRLEATVHGVNSDHLDGFQYTNQLSGNDVYGGVMVAYSYLLF